MAESYKTSAQFSPLAWDLLDILTKTYEQIEMISPEALPRNYTGRLLSHGTNSYCPGLILKRNSGCVSRTTEGSLTLPLTWPNVKAPSQNDT